MKIKLIDGATYAVARAEVTNGRLEIDFKDRPAEEVQEIFTAPGNLANIELITDTGEKFGELPGWIVYGGVMVVGNTKTVIMTKEPDTTAERLARIESNTLQANDTAEKAKVLSEGTATQVTDLQMALCELYEGRGA